MAAYGLYTHIAANKTRSVVLLIGLFLLVDVLVFAGALIGEAMTDGGAQFSDYLARAGHDLLVSLPFATLGSVLWVAIAYAFHQKMIDLVTGSGEVSRKDQPRLYNVLENLCISRGITMPKLKLMPSEARNAFATGLNPRQYAITVTTGLVEALDDREIEAVLGHELTHIRNGDVQMMVVAMIIAGVVGFVGELVFRLFFNSSWRFGGGSSSSSSSSSSSRKGGGSVLAVILAVVLIALSWLLSQLLKLALSRSREFLADAGSVELTKDPDAMISALRKIEHRGELAGATSAVMELCVDNPREGFADLFATHPSVQARIDALVQFAGGHDPGPLPDAESEQQPEPASETAEVAAESNDSTAAPEASPATTAGPAALPGPWGRPT